MYEQSRGTLSISNSPAYIQYSGYRPLCCLSRWNISPVHLLVGSSVQHAPLASTLSREAGPLLDPPTSSASWDRVSGRLSSEQSGSPFLLLLPWMPVEAPLPTHMGFGRGIPLAPVRVAVQCGTRPPSLDFYHHARTGLRTIATTTAVPPMPHIHIDQPTMQYAGIPHGTQTRIGLHRSSPNCYVAAHPVARFHLSQSRSYAHAPGVAAGGLRTCSLFLCAHLSVRSS